MTNNGQSCLPLLLSQASPVPSPCFVLDEERLLANAAMLDAVERKSGAKILLALKGFAAWSVFPLLSRAHGGPLWGTCASSVDEARLGREEFGGEVHAFAAAWSMEEMRELVCLCDHITFNSINQWRQFRPVIEAANAGPRAGNPIKCGLRVNPEHSEGAPAIYNPCSPQSRLGIRQSAMETATDHDLAGITGLHFHTLCEQDADALVRTLAAFEKKFTAWLPRMQWLNFGGGHHITRPGYDVDLLWRTLGNWRQRGFEIYIEPGEAVALNAGWLVATVLDVVQADMPVAILDVSAACHMPDVLEMPYTPQVWYADGGIPALAGEPGQKVWNCRLAGKSCLAGDSIGEYSFASPLGIGQRLVFADMAIYSMVKTTTFNGLRLPPIGICAKDANNGHKFRLVRSFGHDDFKKRLS